MSVDPTTLDGMTLSLLGTPYQGPPGNQGIPGDQGIPGNDGREVEIQKGNGYIQWRYVGDSAWINIVSLSEITGPKGQDGLNGKDGQRGLQGIPGQNGINGVDGVDGQDGTNGIDGTDGEDGREIELQKGATYIQWRYVGDPSWINLVSLAELKGAKGDQGQSFVPNATEAVTNRGNYDNESPGFAFLAIDEGMIYFRLHPTGWSNGMPFGKGDQGDKGETGDTGADGREVEFQRTATHIQWRYIGSSTWINLVPLVDLKGDKGDKGDPGQNGTNGANGANGADGRGITSTAITYQNGASSTVAPTGTWTAAVPATVKGQYLWTRAVITYTDATTSTLYSVAYQGQDGTGGGSEHGIPAGGTAGQMLAKASGDDYDAKWVNPPEGGGGGGDTAFVRALAPNNVVIQSLTPVNICSVPLTAASAYHVQFRATINDNASAKGIRFSVGNIGKREMALRVGYREADGALVFKMITEGGVDNGVTFAGSANSGPGNLVTIDGFLLTSVATTLTVQANNAEGQYDYRQVVQGASLSVEKIGTVTLA